ncbi:MAG: cation:proton antiporter [Firmicutes bacterium HGW-Firmicutes-13]|nr:MAG: cation:proton antiporter [Firmicutes bacterium HGW-Firmicutes-13]
MFLEIIAFIILLCGLFFFMVGVLGLLRLPDVYTRLHATTKCDTLGIGLILFSLILYQGFTAASVKLAIIIIFIWLSNPTAAHAIAKAAYSVDIPMVSGSTYVDQTKEESISS